MCGAAALATPSLGHAASPAQPDAKRPYQRGRSPWPICLDTATIRPATLLDKIKFASEAGFDAIEPWEGELHEYETSGGNLADLGRRIKDAGLFVPSVIGLWNAIPPTREAFDASLTDSRRRMKQAAAIGAQHIQTIPQPARPWREFGLRDRFRGDWFRWRSARDCWAWDSNCSGSAPWPRSLKIPSTPTRSGCRCF